MEKNKVTYRVYGKEALFTTPSSKLGGEKMTYQIPTYEALKGITKSIYWKPIFIWVIDKVKIMNKIRTYPKSIKFMNYDDSKSNLSIYTYLQNVEYEVEAHFEWNLNRPEFEKDRIVEKHYEIMNRMIGIGGKRDICLGSRECQGYVEPCVWGKKESYYDKKGSISFGNMYHGLLYPDEVGENKLYRNFFESIMNNGVIRFPNPHEESNPNLIKEFVKTMIPQLPKYNMEYQEFAL